VVASARCGIAWSRCSVSVGRILFLSSSAGAAALTALALMSPMLPAWPIGAALVAYLAIILTGVLTPRLAMFAPVVSRGTSGRPEIALTFDDGPSPRTTPKVLAELARHDARATFFVLGAKVERHPEIVRAIVAAGHELGVHGQQHDRLLSLRHSRRIEAEIEQARMTVQALTGRKPILFRPPVGHVSPRTAVASRKLGLTLVGWSIRARDGLRQTTAASVVKRVTAGLRPGAIVLLHDASEDEQFEPAGVAALPELLAEAGRRGLACVTLSEALSKRA
jgi:peptidoglycan-N-acetylglucosamine deacetylase